MPKLQFTDGMNLESLLVLTLGPVNIGIRLSRDAIESAGWTAECKHVEVVVSEAEEGWET